MLIDPFPDPLQLLHVLVGKMYYVQWAEGYHFILENEEPTN